MRTEPFTVGIIQDAASDDRQATIDATIPRIREAAERGAQVVCLKERQNLRIVSAFLEIVRRKGEHVVPQRE